MKISRKEIRARVLKSRQLWRHRKELVRLSNVVYQVHPIDWYILQSRTNGMLEEEEK
nr:MAG TPA: hypothetical protein [Caudoviricetes sp.]